MATKIMSNSLLIPLGIPVCLGNFLAMIILFRCHRMITQVRILAINLSVTDFMTGFMLCIPDNIFQGCTYKKYLAGPFVMVSLLTISMFQLDRYLSMMFTFRYHKMMTKRTLVSVCGSFWIFSVLPTYFIFYDEQSAFGIYCGIMYLSPSNTINIVPKCIFLILQFANILMFICLFSQISEILIKGKTNVKTNTGPIRKLSIIIGVYLFCTTPYMVILVLLGGYHSKYIGLAHAVAMGLILINSMINPILYVWRFEEARFQLKLFLFFWNKAKLEEIKRSRNRATATYSISLISSRNTGKDHNAFKKTR